MAPPDRATTWYKSLRARAHLRDKYQYLVEKNQADTTEHVIERAASESSLVGRHAIGANYLWSQRSASYPVAGERRQTLSTVGVYYTLLSSDGFGAPDWRVGAAN